MFQKSKIPKIPKIQNPKSEIPKIQNPKSPKSKIPKIPKIQNPSFFGRILGILDFGDFGFGIPAPKSKIQTPQNPKSKIPKIQNPQNLKSSAKIQNLGRWGPHVKNCSKSGQKSLDFGFWDFGDFGFWGFWILDFGILGILGFWGFWILGILDFGFWWFWILEILDFGFLGRSRGCTTRQFGDGAWRSEARIPPGLPLWATSKPTVSNRVGARKQIEHFFRGQNPTKSQKKPWLPTQRSELYKITEKPRLPTQRSEPYKITEKTQTSNAEVRTLQNHRKT